MEVLIFSFYLLNFVGWWMPSLAFFFLFFRALLCSITFVKRQQSKSNLSVLSFFLLMSHPNSFCDRTSSEKTLPLLFMIFPKPFFFHLWPIFFLPNIFVKLKLFFWEEKPVLPKTLLFLFVLFCFLFCAEFSLVNSQNKVCTF